MRRVHLAGQLKWWLTPGIAHEVPTVAGTASISDTDPSASVSLQVGAVPGVAGTSTHTSGTPQGSRRPHLDAPEASRISAGIRWN